jgi:hypothetical protein
MRGFTAKSFLQLIKTGCSIGLLVNEDALPDLRDRDRDAYISHMAA